MPLQTFYPKIDPDTDPKILFQLIFKTLNNHAHAIVAKPTGSVTNNSTIIETVTSGGGGGGGSSVSIGSVNDQTGNTAYTTQPTDNGRFIVFNAASLIALTLGTGVSTPYFFFTSNYGAGSVNLIPFSGTVNGPNPLPPLSTNLIAFDGVNWWVTEIIGGSGVFPLNAPAVSSEWISAYNALTGAFTQTQPDFSDLTGIATPAQLPIATPSLLGIVEPDNTTIVISGAGVISATGVTAPVPVNAPAVATEWINSYDSTTGIFGQTQPDFTDLTGSATPAQLPVATSSTEGIVQPDNTTITIAAGVISAPAGVTINFADNEVVGGLIDGTNVTFTLLHAPSPVGSLILANQGLVQQQDVAGDYTLSGLTITFLTAPTLGPMIAWYRY